MAENFKKLREKGQCKLCIEDPHELATGIFYIKSIEDV
jgi:hypothetical protein